MPSRWWASLFAVFPRRNPMENWMENHSKEKTQRYATWRRETSTCPPLSSCFRFYLPFSWFMSAQFVIVQNVLSLLLKNQRRKKKLPFRFRLSATDFMQNEMKHWWWMLSKVKRFFSFDFPFSKNFLSNIKWIFNCDFICHFNKSPFDVLN